MDCHSLSTQLFLNNNNNYTDTSVDKCSVSFRDMDLDSSGTAALFPDEIDTRDGCSSDADGALENNIASADEIPVYNYEELACTDCKSGRKGSCGCRFKAGVKKDVNLDVKNNRKTDVLVFHKSNEVKAQACGEILKQGQGQYSKDSAGVDQEVLTLSTSLGVDQEVLTLSTSLGVNQEVLTLRTPLADTQNSDMYYTCDERDTAVPVFDCRSFDSVSEQEELSFGGKESHKLSGPTSLDAASHGEEDIKEPPNMQAEHTGKELLNMCESKEGTPVAQLTRVSQGDLTGLSSIIDQSMSWDEMEVESYIWKSHALFNGKGGSEGNKKGVDNEEENTDNNSCEGQSIDNNAGSIEYMSSMKKTGPETTGNDAIDDGSGEANGEQVKRVITPIDSTVVDLDPIQALITCTLKTIKQDGNNDIFVSDRRLKERAEEAYVLAEMGKLDSGASAVGQSSLWSGAACWRFGHGEVAVQSGSMGSEVSRGRNDRGTGRKSMHGLLKQSQSCSNMGELLGDSTDRSIPKHQKSSTDLNNVPKSADWRTRGGTTDRSAGGQPHGLCGVGSAEPDVIHSAPASPIQCEEMNVVNVNTMTGVKAMALKVNINGHILSGIIDSGAEMSVLKKRYQSLSNSEIKRFIRVRGLVKDSTVVAAVQMVEFTVDDVPFAVEMAVTEMSEDLLLGLDWMQQHGVRLDCGLSCILSMPMNQSLF